MTIEIPHRILVVRLGAIGDVANALIVPTALKERLPGVRIGWAVHELARPLVRGHPAVDHVHCWRKSEGVHGFTSVLREIRRHRYGLALDLQRIFKSGALARLSGAPTVLGFHPRNSKEFSWLWQTHALAEREAHAHMVEHYLGFLRALGFEDVEPHHQLPVDEKAEAWADERLAEIGEAPILISIGASKPPNRWPPHHFADLAHRCVDRFGLPVLLCGSPGDRELAMGTLEGIDRVEKIHDLVGRTSLLNLIALLRRARLFVGCDTGPMHLAASVGVPVLALFGPADPRRTGPWGKAHRVIQEDSHEMDSISVARVLEECGEMLER